MKNRITILIACFIITIIQHCILHLSDATDEIKLWNEFKLFIITYCTWTISMLLLHEHYKLREIVQDMKVPDKDCKESQK